MPSFPRARPRMCRREVWVAALNLQVMRGLRFSSQPIVRLRVLKDSTSFSTEADSASDIIGPKELSSAPQVSNADVRSSVVRWVIFRFFQCLKVDVLSHPSSLLE